MKIERVALDNPIFSSRLTEYIEIGHGVLLELEAGQSLLEAAMFCNARTVDHARMCAEIARGEDFGLLPFSSSGARFVDSADAACLCAGIIDWKWVDERHARMQARRVA